MHRFRPLLHPVSRCIQRSSVISRTLRTSRPLKKTDELAANIDTAKAAKRNTLQVEDDFSFLKLLEERDVARLFSLPPSTLPFDPKSYFQNWSLSTIEPILNEHGQSLFSYLTQLIEAPASRMILGTLDDHQALAFKKHWIAYELEQGNPHAHLPVVEFFLKHGLKMLPPNKGTLDLHNKLEAIDRAEAAKALSKTDISGSWILNRSILDELKGDTIEYPDLMTPDALLDPRDVLEIPPSKDSPFHNRVIVRNHRSVFHDYAEGVEDELLAEDELEEDESKERDEMTQALPVSSKYYKSLQQTILMRRGVVQQTGKGKIRRVAFMVLVGDGNGLVGYGEGKHAHGATALKAARLAAVRNMDYVERFEGRTIWTEMSTKLGSTRLILRPRPVGFGLRCNPNLHRILRAAGLKDVSAKVWGSRNKLNVIKAAFRLLHSGHAPTGMGNGLGGKGKKLGKGSGMKGKADLERARGRKLVSLRK